jgi:hypothetical protein
VTSNHDKVKKGSLPSIETDLFWLSKINNRFSGTDGDKMGTEIIRKAMESHGFQINMEKFNVPCFWSYRLFLNIAIFFIIYLFFSVVFSLTLISQQSGFAAIP